MITTTQTEFYAGYGTPEASAAQIDFSRSVWEKVMSGEIYQGPIPTASVIPNRNNSRKEYKRSDVVGRADSIKEHGLIQNVVIRPLLAPIDGKIFFEGIAGNTRIIAHVHAGINEISKCFISNASESNALKTRFVENQSRTELNPMEISGEYCELVEKGVMTIPEIASHIGKPESYVKDFMALGLLDEHYAHMVASGQIASRYAIIVCTISNTGLKGGFQKSAFDRLANSDKISIREFTTFCSELAENQNQNSLFGDFFKMAEAPIESSIDEKLHLPGDIVPTGSLLHQAAYWDEMAIKWSLRGRGGNAEKCRSASKILRAQITPDLLHQPVTDKDEKPKQAGLKLKQSSKLLLDKIAGLVGALGTYRTKFAPGYGPLIRDVFTGRLVVARNPFYKEGMSNNDILNMYSEEYEIIIRKKGDK